KSILEHTLLAPALTRRWLKPYAFTSDTYLTFGAPWEIVPFPAQSRFPVQIYSKSGQIGLYSTMMGLMPDYHVGFTVLVAGPQFATATVLSDLVVSNFVPAVKRVAASQASEMYVGTYVSCNENSSASFSVTANKGDVGSTLRLDGLVYNGTDLLALFALAQGLDGTTAELVVDVYPTGFRESAGGQAKESWRASFGAQAVGASGSVPELGPFSAACGGAFDLR
ncbi:MAG: hypothetical protein M1823_006658, partial [Watsoniomyces obsoletus]